MTPRARTPARRFEIRLGTPVLSGDDAIGSVHRVVVNPGNSEVSALIVRKGVLLHRDIVIPIEAVTEATEDYIRVYLRSGDLDSLPEFREEDFLEPPPDWKPQSGERLEGSLFRRLPWLSETLSKPGEETTAGSDHGKTIRVGQRVVCRDGEVGRVDMVLIDAATRLAVYFVVRRGFLLRRDRVIPVEWVREIDEDRVLLNVPWERLEELPEYLSDDEITAAVFDALRDAPNRDPLLRQEDILFVDARTCDGVVELRGHTTTEEARKAVEEMVRDVRGVLGVRNEIRSFEVLAQETVKGSREESRED